MLWNPETISQKYHQLNIFAEVANDENYDSNGLRQATEHSRGVEWIIIKPNHLLLKNLSKLSLNSFLPISNVGKILSQDSTKN